MPPIAATQNPVFKELAEIQRYTDVCPNPQDSDFTTCRAKRRDGGRCRNPPCTQYERWQIPSLLSEFRDMTECPDTDSFYNKLETFVTYTHCKRWHRPAACGAFNDWKTERIANRSSSQRRPARPARPRPAPTMPSINVPVIQPITAAALQMLPSTTRVLVPSSASATSDDGSSFDESVVETRSLASNTTFMSSPHHTPLRNVTSSAFRIPEITEEDTAAEEAAPLARMVDEGRIDHEVVVEATTQVVVNSGEQDIATQAVVVEEAARENISREIDVDRVRGFVLVPSLDDAVPQDHEDGDEREDAVTKALGITGLPRSGSVRNHSPVFQIISSHPTPKKMRQGVVYILQHKNTPSLFKIGWSSQTAKQRLHQPNNCYGINNTNLIYETNRFAGAPQAERISQIILRHANIRVLECVTCKGGHREWFAASREMVCDAVRCVEEEFVRMPAYTLRDGEYKLSEEAYDRVVKRMCDFSVLRLGELMRGPREMVDEEASTLPKVSTEAVSSTLPQIDDTPVGMSGHNEGNDLSEMQEANESLISLPLHSITSQRELSAGTRLAKKMKRLFAAGDSVKRYFLRPREPKTQTSDASKRAFGSAVVDLKGKAREAGTKARQEAREFRRDFKEELRRKDEEQVA